MVGLRATSPAWSLAAFAAALCALSFAATLAAVALGALRPRFGLGLVLGVNARRARRAPAEGRGFGRYAQILAPPGPSTLGALRPLTPGVLSPDGGAPSGAVADSPTKANAAALARMRGVLRVARLAGT